LLSPEAALGGFGIAMPCEGEPLQKSFVVGRFIAPLIATALLAEAAVCFAGPVRGARANLHARPADLCPAAPGGFGLLDDGDFSQAQYPGGQINYKRGQTLAPSWVVTHRNVDFTGADFETPGNLCTIDLDGTRRHAHAVGGVAHAAVATTPSVSYQLTFIFSGNGCSPGPETKTMRIEAGDASQLFQWDIANGHDAEHGVYANEAWTFTAMSETTTLTFRSLDPEPSNCGPVIGALSLTQVSGAPNPRGAHAGAR
jgi:hypothetical protein